MITCSSCGKQNQDHYKFCLGCGAELPREALVSTLDETAPHAVMRPKIVDEQTSQGAPEAKPVGADGAGAAVAVAAPPPGSCPQCSHVNPPTNRFCASCGFKLGEVKKAAAATNAIPIVPAKPAAPAVELSGVVLTALSPDGTEAGAYPLPKGTSMIGRETGGIFAGDSYLSPKHAHFTPKPGKLAVKDLGSLNGVFRKLLADQRYMLRSGQIFRIGQELVQFQPLEPAGEDTHGVEPLGATIEGYVGRIAMVLGRRSTGTCFPVPETGLNLGRERGEVLFSDDGYVSGLHCKLSFEEGEVYLTDLGSSNGTFVRILEEEELLNGDILLMGQQLFRVTL